MILCTRPPEDDAKTSNLNPLPKVPIGGVWIKDCAVPYELQFHVPGSVNVSKSSPPLKNIPTEFTLC